MVYNKAQEADVCLQAESDAYWRSGETLQTSEASVSLLSSFTSFSCLAFVTTGSLGPLRTKCGNMCVNFKS